MLSVDRLRKLKEYYDGVIEKNDKIICYHLGNGEYEPWNFEEDEPLEDDDYYYDDDDDDN